MGDTSNLEIDEDCGATVVKMLAGKDEKAAAMNWVAYGYSEDSLKKKKKKIVQKQSGEGGLPELITYLKEHDGEVSFCGLKVQGVDKRKSVTSTRSKLILIVYIGGSVNLMVKGNVSGHTPEVSTKVFRAPAVTIQVDHKDLAVKVEPANIATELLRCGGAHKPSYYDFGGDVHHDVSGAAAGDAL